MQKLQFWPLLNPQIKYCIVHTKNLTGIPCAALFHLRSLMMSIDITFESWCQSCFVDCVYSIFNYTVPSNRRPTCNQSRPLSTGHSRVRHTQEVSRFRFYNKLRLPLMGIILLSWDQDNIVLSIMIIRAVQTGWWLILDERFQLLTSFCLAEQPRVVVSYCCFLSDSLITNQSVMSGFIFIFSTFEKNA